MNESERDRILQMVSEGLLRPGEAARLLASLAPEPPAQSAPNGAAPAEAKPKPAPKQPEMEVQMQRPDGTYYTVRVPPTLVPMLWKMAQVAIKESVRNAAHETWSGIKTIAHDKTESVKTSVRDKFSGPRKPPPASEPPAEPPTAEARRRILQMVQNGRLTATDAARLIEQVDAAAKQ